MAESQKFRHTIFSLNEAPLIELGPDWANELQIRYQLMAEIYHIQRS